jgi:OOP family OmpA-OmpF porin
MRRYLILTLTLLFSALCPALVQAADVAGSKDYPGIGRFKDSEITGYQVKDFDAAKMQGAAFANRKPVNALRIEGRVTRIAYRIGGDASMLEVSRNFETQLTSAGFKTLLSCDADVCGEIPFSEAIDALPIPKMWVDGFSYHYFSAVKEEGATKTYASVLVSKNNDNVTAQLTIAVSGAIENKMVNAADMSKGLGEKGHIALYGIYFDTDKTVVKPESAPTLEQIAKLLTDQPALKVIIVGHTDNQGSISYNMNLSQRRAEAVASALVQNYKIDKARLQTGGVGYLAPVASNASEDGRALNRRVELVSP